MPQTLDLLLLMLPLLALALVVSLAYQARLLSKEHQTTKHLLTSLLIAESQKSQSLLNQLRSGDPMTLNSLQYATGISQSNEDEEYAPSYDEGITYQERLNHSEYGTAEADDDLNARGWEPVTVRDSGNPVQFRDDA